nr:NADH dehydrogenase subunit 1 [Neohydatothrips samayunkur]
MYLAIYMLMIFMSLISVAFITLMERKILGFMQIRQGPNKTGLLGMLQPMSDAVKLYSKETVLTVNSNKMTFILCPMLSLLIALCMWIIMPFLNPFLSFNFSILFLLSILGIGIYPILIAGWSSNSNYSLLGGMRSLAQSISYEVSLIFILLSNFIMMTTLKLNDSLNHQKLFFFCFFIMQTIMWLISCLAEMSRTPFDFAEGESELVSGFNTEYSSGTFAMIFMAEYMMIMIFSYMTKILFLGSKYISLDNSFFLMLIMYMFIWTRATFPRYRYDKLMYLCWKIILPTSTLNLMLVCFLTLLKW